MAKDDKRGAAKALYMAGFTQKDIAKITRLSANTIGTWAANDNWRERRIKANMIEENSSQRLMDIFDYQIECLHREMEARKESGEYKPFENGNFDALQKLFSTVKSDFQKFKIHAQITKQFVDFLQSHDVELAKSIIPIAQLYLSEKQQALA